MLGSISVFLSLSSIVSICSASIVKNAKENVIEYAGDERIGKPADMSKFVNRLADDWIADTFQSMAGGDAVNQSDISPTVSRNHYSVGERMKVQKYCVKTKDENACMEVGYMEKPIHEYPIKLRLRRDANLDYEDPIIEDIPVVREYDEENMDDDDAYEDNETELSDKPSPPRGRKGKVNKKLPKRGGGRRRGNPEEDESFDDSDDETRRGNGRRKQIPKRGRMQKHGRTQNRKRVNDYPDYEYEGQENGAGSQKRPRKQKGRRGPNEAIKYDDDYEYEGEYDDKYEKKGAGKPRKPAGGKKDEMDVAESQDVEDVVNTKRVGSKNRGSVGINDLEEKDDVKNENRVEEDVQRSDSHESHDWNHCKLPSPRNTFEALCKMLPGEVKCNLYCIFGHTFNDGIMRKTTCSYATGVWTKHFEECKPFADCSLKLKSAGTLNCKTNTVKESTKCTVSCERYESYDAVNEQMHECESSGRWKPALPHCVTREGIDTVEPPEIREHKEIKYP